MLYRNADINQGDSHGVTALHRAAANHSTQMVKCLLRHNADVNAVDDKGQVITHSLYAVLYLVCLLGGVLYSCYTLRILVRETWLHSL